MLEILVVMAVIAILMARKGRGRRAMGRYLRGNIDETKSLGGLGANTGIVQAFDGTVSERTFVSSIVASWSMQGWTDTDNTGPITVGLAHGDYTLAEIEAWVEQAGAATWEEGDLIAREVSDRKIRKVGTFGSAGGGLLGSVVLNDGRNIKTKLNWILNAGQGIQMWAYNNGSAAVSGTTVPDVTVQGHANLWPR